MRVDVLGVGFDAVTPEEAVLRALEMMESPGGKYVVTPNPEIVWMCRQDAGMMEAVRSANLVLADGIGVVNAAKDLGRPLPGRVPGVDWFGSMLSECAQRGKRVFLLGGKPGVAEGAASKMRDAYPGLVVCGAQDGYFTDDVPVLDMIRSAKPDFLAVCLGAPKQELWMARNAGALGDVLMAGLGGSLDVWAGTKRRAPVFWRKMKLEWLYSALRQPSRIPRLLVIPKFLRAVRRQKRKERHG